MKESIGLDEIKSFGEAFDSNPINRVAMNAAVHNGIHAASESFDVKSNNPHAFSIDLESGECCDQKSSGRCWMFASLNLMRLEVMNKLNLKNMELSQSYPFFWDKLERSNYFLENILDTLDMPLKSREVAYLLEDPLGDGGQWDMFRSLIDKYGVVPQDVYPESHSSSSTSDLNNYLTKKMREYACLLRRKAGSDIEGGESEGLGRKLTGEEMDGLRAEKDEMLKTVYRMLCISLGKPPETFTWKTKDKDGKFVGVEDISPKEFFDKYVGWNLDDKVTVINAPTSDKPYYKTYTVKYLGNVKDGKYPVKYLNLPVEDLKTLAVKQLKAGQAVWFGCDVSQFSNEKKGLLTLDAYDTEGLFQTKFPMNKRDRLDYGESRMTHAMAITGVDLDKKGLPLRWKVENSWGKKDAYDGYMTMGDDWFSEYVYQILLDKKYLTAKQKKTLENDPIELEAWDPMGSLAR
jgi:bleomycin hydrolase